MQLIAIQRERKNKPEAVNELRVAKEDYGSIPDAEALAGWFGILDPPLPPITYPTKLPKR